MSNSFPTSRNERLKDLLDSLSAAATPGSWNPDPKRLTIPLADGRVAQGPLMSYLVGNIAEPEGMKVSLGSERVADHRFVAALVNAYRDGELTCTPSETVERICPDCGVRIEPHRVPQGNGVLDA